MHIDLTTRPAPRNPFRPLSDWELEANRAALIEAFASLLPPHCHALRAEWTAKVREHDERAGALKAQEVA